MAEETENVELNDDSTDLEILSEESPDENEESTEESSENETNEENEDENEEVTEEEGDESEEEEPTLDTGFSRPTKKEIIAKYPDFFKDFPDVQNALFREKKFNEEFSSIEEAQEIKEKAENFDNLQDLFLSDKKEDINTFFKTVNESNPGTLKNLAPHLLGTFYSLDKEAYDVAITPLLESVVRSTFQEGVRAGNDNLKNAAILLARNIFGDIGDDIAKGTKTTTRKVTDPALEEERKKLNTQKAEIELTKYNEFRGKVINRSDKSLMKMIVKDFDPDKAFDDGIKEILHEKVHSEVEKVLIADKRFQANQKKLWEQARKAGFTGDWEARIISTFLARAKSVMPAIRQKIRAKALNQKQEQSNNLIKKGKLDSNRPEVKGGNVNGGVKKIDYSPKKIDYSKTSDMDILNDRVVNK